jgi:hypothetical protein
VTHEQNLYTILENVGTGPSRFKGVQGVRDIRCP